ncbi:MAG: hypothetical protein U1F27_02940 [Turneriella sp.]
MKLWPSCSALFLATAVFAGTISLKPVDLKGKSSVCDDTEPDWKKPIAIPNGKPEWAFTFAEAKPFKELKDKLGMSNFKTLMAKHRFKMPKTEFDGFKGRDGLPLHYYLRPGAAAGQQLLFVVSLGEYQPARYIAHLEGIWQLSGAEF